jgi:CubicO group peptidase (beta-lactamase class C family)
LGGTNGPHPQLARVRSEILRRPRIHDSRVLCQQRAELKVLLQTGLARYPGIAMLVQSGNRKESSAAVGYSDLEKRKPLKVDAAFHMASINKTFTAVAILVLVDEGKLSLDSTLKDQLGEAVGRIPYADRIKVSQLLDHSSGPQGYLEALEKRPS